MPTLSNPFRPCRSKLHPCLTFAPLAWLKLLYFCHTGATEVGGFGIAAADDLLYVENFVTVRQQVTPVSVRFGDDAVADFFDRSVEAGLPPQRFARIWIHTHPGASVTPSSTDEETFARSFGACDWALMFILGRTGQTYARLSFSAGPGGQFLIPTNVDWFSWPAGAEHWVGSAGTCLSQWQHEYAAHIHVQDRAPDRAPLERLLGPFAESVVWDGGLDLDNLDGALLEEWEERDFDEPHTKRPLS